MLRVLIVDDEAPARFELRSLLEETGKVAAISEVSSARDAVASLVKSRERGGDAIDVLFLDVSMPKTSGMQLADALHKLKNPPAIVFVTAYSEYAVDAFGVDAVDYLLKPVEMDRLQQAISKVEARLKTSTAQAGGTVNTERIPVEKGGHKVLVPVNHIRYVEAKDDYACIYTDTDRYLSTISLAKLEQRLNPYGFYRVHRGYIVNLDYVQDFVTISGGVVQLGLKDIEDKKIPVSRRRVVAVKRMLGL